MPAKLRIRRIFLLLDSALAVGLLSVFFAVAATWASAVPAPEGAIRQSAHAVKHYRFPHATRDYADILANLAHWNLPAKDHGPPVIQCWGRPAHALELKLLGTAVSNGVATAVVESGHSLQGSVRETHTYQVGDWLQPTLRLHHVSPRFILLDNAGTLEWLSMDAPRDDAVQAR